MELLVPESLGLAWAMALVAAAFVTAAISAAFGIGGGVAMLAILLAVLPPVVVLPVHGVVQAGANASRVMTLRRN
ncbi:MAG: sulfite exporter TauE/SafE family protein, partial [Lautropia sp.]